MRKAEFTIPTILGILLTIAGLVAGVWLLREPLRTLVGASAEETPQEVRITNVSDTSFVVSWITSKSTSGFIQYDETGREPQLTVSDDRDQQQGQIGSYFTHYVTVRGLKAATNYAFRIGSGRNLYDQQEQLYAVTTGPTLANPPTADVAYGQVDTQSGEPAEGALVYVSLPGVVPQATLVRSSGSWVVPLSTARTSDLTSYAAYDRQSSQLSILVQGATLGTSTVQVTTDQDSPVATIVLGEESLDTANLITNTNLPNAIVPTPTPNVVDAQSKFSTQGLGSSTPATTTGELVLLTPASGEKVNTSTPIITGTAPKNAKVTIEINSENKIVTEVRADANGEFEYTVPEGLEPGTHTVTISTLVNGVLKKITKSFVVEAAGESVAPVKTATPSGQILTTPTPTPKATIKPTATPRVTIPSTESGVPASGELTPTLLLLILGTALVFAGAFSYRKLN
jgi:hypothetical protein